MGKLTGGLYGHIQGKVGNLVHYQLLGSDVVRLIGKNTKAPSAKQLANRQGMATIIAFLKPMTAFVRMGFYKEAERANKYPHNLAVSYNRRYALKGVYPEIAVDYERVLVSKGSLPAATGATVSSVPEGLLFNWSVSPEMDFDERNHIAMLLAYFLESGKAVYGLNGAKRYEGRDLLCLPNELQGKYCETYLAFMELGSREVSDSVYVR